MVSAHSTHSYSVIESCSNAYSMCNLMYKHESSVSIYRTLFLGKNHYEYSSNTTYALFAGLAISIEFIHGQLMITKNDFKLIN